jgi:hypothetical protein
MDDRVSFTVQVHYVHEVTELRAFRQWEVGLTGGEVDVIS